MNGCQESPMCEDARPVNRTILTERKRCPKCGEIKSLNDFGFDKRRIDQKRYVCKICANKAARQYAINNPEKVHEACKLWHKNNLEKVHKRHKQWIIDNPEKIKQQRKNYREKFCEASKRYKKNHPEKVREARREYYQNNTEKMLEVSKRNTKKNRKTLKGNLNNRMSVRIRTSLKRDKQGKQWKSLVDFTLEQLKKHLERRFLPGMTWENRDKWHIDHIIPLAVFNFKTAKDEDFKKAWALKNLQPLWKADNLHKSKKLTKPFQPSLIFWVIDHIAKGKAIKEEK